MTPQISQEPSAAATVSGREQHAPLPRSVAAGRGQQGAVFFLTLLEKTIPKPTQTGLEHEAVRQKRDIHTRFPTTT